MKNFFLNSNKNLIITIFSKYHFGLVILTFLIVCLIRNNKEIFIKMNKKNKKIIRSYLAIILIINFILRRGSFLYYGVYNWQYHLDINFCNFTSILFFIYSLTGNRKIYTICYYMTFIGPLLSIIFPSNNLSPLNYSFYSFIVLHHLVFIYNIIFMFNENMQFNKKEFKKTVIFLIIYFSIIYIFNYIFDTTYNKPLTFVNSDVEMLFIDNLLKINYIEYFFMFILIVFSLIIANTFIKFSYYKK